MNETILPDIRETTIFISANGSLNIFQKNELSEEDHIHIPKEYLSIFIKKFIETTNPLMGIEKNG